MCLLHNQLFVVLGFVVLESSSRRALFDFEVRRELHQWMILILRFPFQFLIVLLQFGDYYRIEAGACFHLYVPHGFIQRQRAAILTIGCERVQAIHCSQNAGSDRNLFSTQAEGISTTVPLFVVSAHDRNYRIRELHALQNLCPNDRVNFHLLEFFRGQLAGLRDDVFGHRQFAYVVK